MAADELPYLLGSLCPSFDCSADAADVALHDRRDKCAADANALDDLHVRGFRHCVGRLDEGQHLGRGVVVQRGAGRAQPDADPGNQPVDDDPLTELEGSLDHEHSTREG